MLNAQTNNKAQRPPLCLLFHLLKAFTLWPKGFVGQRTNSSLNPAGFSREKYFEKRQHEHVRVCPLTRLFSKNVIYAVLNMNFGTVSLSGHFGESCAASGSHQLVCMKLLCHNDESSLLCNCVNMNKWSYWNEIGVLEGKFPVLRIRFQVKDRCIVWCGATEGSAVWSYQLHYPKPFAF